MSVASPFLSLIRSSSSAIRLVLESAAVPTWVAEPLSWVVPTIIAYKTLGYVFNGFWQLFLRPAVRGGALTHHYKLNDAWAVVTGCTDGIGKQLAIGLAEMGYNLLLLSRNQAKLDETKKAVESKGVKALSVPISFDKASAEDWQRVNTALQGKVITVLINNVGVSYNHAAYFHEEDEAVIDSIIAVNIDATHKMTRLVLPFMQSQRLGLVVNVSSGTAFLPTGAYLSSYAASKVYINSWTNAMNDEYAPNGVRFETLVPFQVSTNMSKIKRSSLAVPPPEKYAKSALQWIGCADYHTGYLSHQVQLYLLEVMPTWFSHYMSMKLHRGVRELAIAKKLREQKQN